MCAADIVVLTTTPKKLRRVAVFSADPEVGPLSGGTEVTLQVLSKPNKATLQILKSFMS